MVEAAIMELPRTSKEGRRASQALIGLKESLSNLAEKRVPFSDFVQRLRAQSGAEKQKDPEVESILGQAQELVMAKLEEREREPLTAKDISRMAREGIEALSIDASPEVKERLEAMKAKTAEVDAEGISGNIGDDPREAVERLMISVAGEEEGRQLYEGVARATGENPYPKPEEKKLPTGLKGVRGKGKYWLFLGGSIGILVACGACGFLSTLATRTFVGPETEASTREEIEEANVEWATQALIDGSYDYPVIETWLKRGGPKAELARERLDAVARRIVAGAASLDEVTDPQLIARLIYDYQQDYPGFFEIDIIEDSGKKARAESHLGKLFEEGAPRREPGVIIIEEETSKHPRPSLRQTAAARAQQKTASFQARASKTPPGSYQSRGGRFYSKGKTSGERRA